MGIDDENDDDGCFVRWLSGSEGRLRRLTVTDRSGVLRSYLLERRRKGLDRGDEIWNGVYHMTPDPNVDHQEELIELASWLRSLVKDRGLGRVLPGGNVRRPGSGVEDFRCPDILFVSTERFAIIGNVFYNGAPDIVMEIRSPGDDTMKKVPWYLDLGCREVWVIHRDKRTLDLYRPPAQGKRPRPAATTTEGAEVLSDVLPVRFQRAVRPDGKSGLRVSATDEPAGATML
jgi:Uma2 family endonuclease